MLSLFDNLKQDIIVKCDSEHAYVKPETFTYENVSQNVTSESLGGSVIDGHWVERVKVSLSSIKSFATQKTPVEEKTIVGRQRFIVYGAGESSPVTQDIEFVHQSSTTLDSISKLSVDYTPTRY